jgi:hypothetical protein
MLRAIFSSSSLFAIVFFVCGVSLYLDYSFLGGTAFILIGMFFFVPGRMYFYEKTGIRLNRLQRFLIAMGIFIGSVALSMAKGG